MKLTPQQAIEKGYTHFVSEGDEHAHSLQRLIDGHYYMLPGKQYYLCTKPYRFHLDADTIQGILSEYLEVQTDVYDENEVLPEELAKADFDAIEKLVNVGFTDRWMDAEDVELDLTDYYAKEVGQLTE